MDNLLDFNDIECTIENIKVLLRIKLEESGVTVTKLTENSLFGNTNYYNSLNNKGVQKKLSYLYLFLEEMDPIHDQVIVNQKDFINFIASIKTTINDGEKILNLYLINDIRKRLVNLIVPVPQQLEDKKHTDEGTNKFLHYQDDENIGIQLFD